MSKADELKQQIPTVVGEPYLKVYDLPDGHRISMGDEEYFDPEEIYETCACPCGKGTIDRHLTNCIYNGLPATRYHGNVINCPECRKKYRLENWSRSCGSTEDAKGFMVSMYVLIPKELSNVESRFIDSLNAAYYVNWQLSDKPVDVGDDEQCSDEKS